MEIPEFPTDGILPKHEVQSLEFLQVSFCNLDWFLVHFLGISKLRWQRTDRGCPGHRCDADSFIPYFLYSGVDVGVVGLAKTSEGKPKIIDSMAAIFFYIDEDTS
jgi:hypothetical protein